MSDTQHDTQRQAIHDAIQATVKPDEHILSWVLTAEVRYSNGRYLAHRSGAIGGGNPHIWTIEGMLRSAIRVAESLTEIEPDDEPDD